MLRSTARLAREHGDREARYRLPRRSRAQDELARAYMAVDGDDDVELDVLLCASSHPADALAAEALSRGADEIVLADPSRSGLRRRERRRLRRRSPVPVNG